MLQGRLNNVKKNQTIWSWGLSLSNTRITKVFKNIIVVGDIKLSKFWTKKS